MQYNPDSVSDPNDIIKRITDSEDLIDLLIDLEDYLDGNNIYAFANWIDGELVKGPIVKKYWVTVTLKWKYDKMPDPRAARRLLAQGTRIEFSKSEEEENVTVKTPADFQPGTKKPKLRKVPVWLVKISVPRRFVSNIDDEVLDLYDQDIDSETIEDAAPEDVEQSPPVAGDQNNAEGGRMAAPGEEETLGGGI